MQQIKITRQDAERFPGNTRWNVIAYELGAYEAQVISLKSGKITDRDLDGFLRAQSDSLKPYRPIPRKDAVYKLGVEGIHDRAVLKVWLNIIDP